MELTSRYKITQALKIMQRLFKETQNEKIKTEIENLKKYKHERVKRTNK